MTTGKMWRGAFVMLDALGFKGIWNRDDVKEDPSSVLQKLEGIAERAKTHALDRLDGRVRVPLRGFLQAFEVTLLSDTIAAGIVLDETRLEEGAKTLGENALVGYGGISIQVAADFASEVIRIAAELPTPPLALRGAISWGAFMMRASCMVGPAVDEAASCATSAEAAVVFCAASALQMIERTQAPLVKASARSLARPSQGRQRLRHLRGLPIRAQR